MGKLLYVIHVIAVFNEMCLDSIPDELEDFKKLEESLISNTIIFKK